MGKYNLQELTAVVTGASSGIGREIAKKLIERYGCRVIGVGRSEERFTAFSGQFGEKSEKFSYRLFDVGERGNWEEFVRYLGREKIMPDLVVNCAGVLPKFSYYEANAEEVLKTNFLSAVYSYETLGPLLRSNARAKIVNVGSSSALCPFAGVAAYCASKAALFRFTECIALEKGIDFAAILPGFTSTDVFRSQHFDEKSRSLFGRFSMSADRMSDKIIKAIAQGKRRKIIGIDAHLMNFGYKFFPQFTPRLVTRILKSLKSEGFGSITR